MPFIISSFLTNTAEYFVVRIVHLPVKFFFFLFAYQYYKKKVEKKKTYPSHFNSKSKEPFTQEM